MTWQLFNQLVAQTFSKQKFLSYSSALNYKGNPWLGLYQLYQAAPEQALQNEHVDQRNKVILQVLDVALSSASAEKHFWHLQSFQVVKI